MGYDSSRQNKATSAATPAAKKPRLPNNHSARSPKEPAAAASAPPPTSPPAQARATTVRPRGGEYATNDWAVGEDRAAFARPHNRRLPAYLVPAAFTDRFAARSEDRRAEFVRKLREWVRAHENAPASQTWGPGQKQKDLKAARTIARALERAYVPLPAFRAALARHLQALDRAMQGPYYLVVQTQKQEVKTGGKTPRVRVPSKLRPWEQVPKSSAWLAREVQDALKERHAMQGLLVSKYFLADMPSLQVVDAFGLSNGSRSPPRWPLGAGRNIVFVDDAIYSGQQLIEFVASLNSMLAKAPAPAPAAKGWRKRRRGAAAAATDTGGTGGHTHLWIVIPYRTPRGQWMMEALEHGTGPFSRLHPDLKVHVVTDAPGPRPFEPIPAWLETRIQAGMVDRDDYIHDNGRGVAVFEHKVPDNKSFPDLLKRGLQVWNLDRPPIPRWNTETAGQLGAVPFVSQNDVKPYGTEAPGMFKHLLGRRYD
jgi:hypothetical protein